jgi:predicted ester cyclase
MTSFLDRLLQLWVTPLPEGDAATAAFREFYADPVLVNGTELPTSGLVDRARAVQGAFDGLRAELLDAVEAPERMVIAFVMTGRQVGPLATPLGTVPPTGRTVRIRTIDVLTVVDGRVTRVWVVADELGLLQQLDAVSLNAP